MNLPVNIAFHAEGITLMMLVENLIKEIGVHIMWKALNALVIFLNLGMNGVCAAETKNNASGVQVLVILVMYKLELSKEFGTGVFGEHMMKINVFLITMELETPKDLVE